MLDAAAADPRPLTKPKEILYCPPEDTPMSAVSSLIVEFSSIEIVKPILCLRQEPWESRCMKCQRVCELTPSIDCRSTDLALFNTHFPNGNSRSPDVGPASKLVPRRIHSYTKHALIVRCHRLDNGPVDARHHA